ncbi:MAG: hypothetical protein AMS17_00700 [Spirochaetes bacterium DG_61]|nr:MAG: hypothetical protein AMS17_00700 [Spirochaetes bacterium DG_61]
MILDIRNNLNYNYKITAQKFRDTFVNADRFGTSQMLYDSAERNIKTLEDLITIIRELKKERKYGIVDSYSEDNAIVKLEVKAEIFIRDIKEKGTNFLELNPQFLRKAREIFDIYDNEIKKIS